MLSSGTNDSPAGPLRRTLGIVLIVAGGLGFAIFLVTSLVGVFGGMERVEIPGTRELQLAPGSYTIYWETDSRFNRVPSLSDLEILVSSRDRTIVLGITTSGLLTSRYSMMDRVGVSLADFSVRHLGDYAVRVAAAAGKSLPQGRLAVGRSLGFLGVLRLVALCFAILAAGLGPGLYLLINKGEVRR